MKTLSQLTDFYYKNLFPTLEALELQRKNLRYRVILVGLFFTLVCVVLVSLLPLETMNIELFYVIIFAYFAIGTLLYKFLTQEYTDEFKTKVLKPLIHAIDEKLIYTTELHVSQRIFERSELFTSRVDKISGNDHVMGLIDGTKIEFSDIHAQQRHKNSKGKESWSTIFRGLFIVADFNKNFIGRTVVLPESAQNIFGDLIGNWLQSKNFLREELVKLDDSAFEKEFVVYATDQIEARYILSHSLMQRLLTFKKKANHPLYISFIGGSIHMEIDYGKDLFEPSIFHSLLKYKIAMEYVSTLHLALGIVEELKLNQKIWSKR